MNGNAPRSEKQKMLCGELYDSTDAELSAERANAQALSRAFSEATPEARASILSRLLGAAPSATITPPFRCDYGYNIHLGESVYMNFDCVFLDVCRISIGARTLLGPGVHVYTALHPLDASTRRRGLESGRPVALGCDVWIGGGTIICPGVSIGDRTVIGAGSVVIRDIPADVFAAGNPCRIIRHLNDNESF